MVSSVHWQHCIVKVGSLEHLGHILDFLKAQGLVLLKDYGLADSFHAVLYQDFAVYFGDHEFNFKLLAELLRLAKLKNCFF